MDTRTQAEAIIRDAAAANEPLAIARVALAFAAFERARVGLDRYLEHLDRLAADVAKHSADHPGEHWQALSEVVAGEHGYRGDELTYDDPQNANLMRVIDRRKGLPVALGILYIETGRRLGWKVEGLSFPAHFLIRLESEGSRKILDPFHGGVERRTPELRSLLKSLQGADAELEPAYFEPVPDRAVLLRLQNNIKIRLIRSGDLRGAIEVVTRMRWLAPDELDLMREAGLIHARLGEIHSAIERLEEYVRAETREPLRHRAARTLQSLKAQLH